MPPSAKEVVRAFVKDSPYVFTGPEYWNALGLGSTAVFPVQPVYNTKRSGEYQLGGAGSGSAGSGFLVVRRQSGSPST